MVRPARTDPDPVRQHVKMLAFRRMSFTEMADASEVARSTIVGLMHTGEREWASIRCDVADRLLAIPMPEGYLTPNVGAAAPQDAVEDEDDDEPTDLPEDTIAAAQRVVASFATDAPELRTFLAMLGIGPGSSTALCGKCYEPISRAANEGYNRRASGGRCGKCVVAAEKAVSA